MVVAYDDFLVHYLAMPSYTVYIALFDCDDFPHRKNIIKDLGKSNTFQVSEEGVDLAQLIDACMRPA